jgi:hypothetical protein
MKYYKLLYITLFIIKLCFIFTISNGDWGLGPIPNPQSPFIFKKEIIFKKIKLKY